MFGKLTPSAATLSSMAGGNTAANALSPGSSNLWMSAANTENQEYLQYDMGTTVLLTGLFCSFVNGRDGSSPRITASNDTTTWDTVHTFVSGNYSPSVDGYRNYSAVINTSKTYRYVRVQSGPTVYCAYAYVQYFGT
jgi:hypothetical protein